MGAISYTAERELVNDDAGFVALFGDLGAGVVDITLHRGTGVATYTRATEAWTILADGTYGLVASGVPRSYYSPSGTYLGYLSEAAATNLCQRGEDFATVWASVGTPTLSAGSVTLGALSLSTLGDDAAGTLEGKTQTITFTGNAVKAIAVHVKKGTSTSTVIRLRDTSAGADRLLAVVTWSGTVPVVAMTTGTDLTGTPEQFGTSGVYRLLLATTSVTAANTNSLQLYPATDAALAVGGTGTIEIGGVQAENSTFPSTLIRTPASASVTRNADVLTYPFSGNASATVGTCYAELSTFWSTSNSADHSHAVCFGTSGHGPLLVDASQASTRIVINDATNPNPAVKTGLTDLSTAVRKRASSWGVAGLSITGDGAAVATATFDTVMESTSIGIGTVSAGGAQWCGTIKNARIDQSQDTNAVLQQMTDPAADYAHLPGESYTLESQFEQGERSVRVVSNKHQPLGGGAPHVLLNRREVEFRLSTDVLTEAELPQWREFFASVEGGEEFTLDRYGTIAAPVEPKQAVLSSESYEEQRLGGQLYRIAFSVLILD